jgi:hypothetical protein
MEAIDALLDPSKIHGAAHKIFNNETVDLVHVSADSSRFRVFLKPMDELVLKSCGN